MFVTKAVAVDGLRSVLRRCGGWLSFGSTLSRATISSSVIFNSESKFQSDSGTFLLTVSCRSEDNLFKTRRRAFCHRRRVLLLGISRFVRVIRLDHKDDTELLGCGIMSLLPD